MIAGFGVLCFLSAALFGVLNMVKFRQHRSLSLGLFYVCGTACLLMRSIYFVDRICRSDVVYSERDLTYIVIASSFSTSMTASQLLTYILLIIRLNLYFLERENP